MYKVFFVDDEAATRGHIRNNIDWENSDFTLVGEAPDGEIALSLIREMMPDILITDVRMPFMDGIELAKKVKESMPWIKVIILSGHDEFVYAKQAITIGVEEYILKPVTSHRLMESLDKTAQIIKDEKAELENIERLLDNTKKIQLERLLSDIIYRNISLENARVLSEKLGMKIDAKYYLIIYFEIHVSEKDSYKYYQSAHSNVRMLLSGIKNTLFFNQGSNRTICVLKGDDPVDILEEAYSYAQIVKYEVERSVQCRVAAAIGSVVSDVFDWSKSLEEAQIVMRYLNLFKKNQILTIQEVNNNQMLSFSDIHKLPTIDKIRYTSKADIDKLIEDIFDSSKLSSFASYMYVNYTYVDILMSASKLINELGGKSEEVLADFISAGNIIMRDSDLENIRKTIYDVISLVMDFRDAVKGYQHNSVIIDAQKYIKMNYHKKSITLHSVAEQVSVSPNHFSTIFSQQTGETFISYLTKTRIDQAKFLLKTTNLRTSEIGYQVGYNDTHYFSYVFKKNVGMTPKEYRQGQIGH